MQSRKKTIHHMISIVTGSITDTTIWNKYNIDTLVNTANPTLMGSHHGVDGQIHSMFDQYLKEKYQKEKIFFFKPDFEDTLNKNICCELKTTNRPRFIRCKRGDAITTDGYGLCNKIIHVVGAKYDGNPDAYSKPEHSDYCTSSCIHILESCYFNIIKEVRKHSDIKSIGVPIIGSGTYNVPFELAVKIAIASIGNALLDWKNQDEEAFEYAGIEQVVFFIYDSNKNKEKELYNTANTILTKYKTYFSQNEKVVFQTSKEAHYRYLKEIKLNDEKRGYFTLAKSIRLLLIYIRIAFLPLMYLKDFFGKESWQKRRKTVEFITLTKSVLPICLGISLQLFSFFNCVVPKPVVWFLIFLTLYCLLDTLTYLLLLIIMSDIQRPSANIIRSIIMLFINYIEVGSEFAFLYTIFYKINFLQALELSFLGKEILPTNTINPYIDFALNIGSSSIKFFFTTLVFGYFFSHMKQRKFRS